MVKEIELGYDAEGNAVTSMGINMNVGSGLSDAVKVAPIDAKMGDEVYVAVRAVVREVRFAGQLNDDGEVESVQRVLVLKPSGATFIDGSKVRSVIQRTVDNVAQWKQEQKDGQKAFDLVLVDEGDDADITDIRDAK